MKMEQGKSFQIIDRQMDIQLSPQVTKPLERAWQLHANATGNEIWKRKKWRDENSEGISSLYYTELLQEKSGF